MLTEFISDNWIIIFSYLLGSIPFGLVVSWAFGKDIRQSGSGNIGATNAARVLGSKAGALVLILDMLKGVAAVALANWWAPQLVAVSILAAVVGHLFPIWLKFKGGKGVATIIGATLVAFPQLGVLAVVIWLITFFLFKYSSLASLVAVCSLVMTHNIFYFIAIALIIYKHRDNILRLLRGQENRFKR